MSNKRNPAYASPVPGTPGAAVTASVQAESYLREMAERHLWPRLAECADAIADLRELVKEAAG